MVCVHLSFDIVHRLGRSTDLPRYCNYIIVQFLLSCILIQVLEASPTPLIAWNLSSPLHDKCIWTQSVCNGFLLRERYGPRAKADQRCTCTRTHTLFFCRATREMLCVCVEETDVWRISCAVGHSLNISE